MPEVHPADPLAASDARPLIVCGGVHGDEPSGALVLEALAREGFLTVGPCNPWGLARRRRGLATGADLNRSFAYAGCPEAERVRASLERQPPGLLLDLHEDARARAPYVIQIGPADACGEELISALGDRFSFAPRPRFGPLRGRAGLLRPRAWQLMLQRLSRRWSLIFYAWHRFGCPALVVEAPGAWPLEQRMRLHRAVCLAARALLNRRQQITGPAG